MEKQYKKISKDYVILSYDYMHNLGRGSFADVYLCRKIENDKVLPEIRVAKEIHFQRKTHNMQELIQKEIELMLQLTGDDELMPKIYDYFLGQNSKDMYIIMEYCEGGDLEKYLDNNGPMLEETIALFLHPVAKFFEKLHEMGVIHRDLKLANILISKKIVEGEEPKLKVSDFGLARVMDDNEAAYTTCGTPFYMAPEIWNGEKMGYSNKVDVWAFGNIIYKMLYGDYLFVDIDVEKRIKQGMLKFPKIRITSLEAMDLMLKCFRKDPVNRISFAEIVKHPFFTKKEFKPFTAMFDGLFGFTEINNDNVYDLLADPNCLGITKDTIMTFNMHNEEILKEWQKAINKSEI